MCGLAGMILAPKKRSRREIDRLVESFTRLLICSERRGPHATGVAWVKADGTHQVEKAPLPAREFVDTWRYAAWVDGIEAQTILLMGHTRWPTRGSELNPDNNHPLVVTQETGSVILTHYAESEFMLSHRATSARVGANLPVSQHIIFRLQGLEPLQ